jgi:hypothetical protein
MTNWCRHTVEASNPGHATSGTGNGPNHTKCFYYRNENDFHIARFACVAASALQHASDTALPDFLPKPHAILLLDCCAYFLTRNGFQESRTPQWHAKPQQQHSCAAAQHRRQFKHQ